MTLSDIPGKVKVPNYLPLGLVLAVAIFGALGWRDLHSHAEQTQRELTDLKAARTQSLVELKAKDAELTAAVATMRDAATLRQEALLTRLTRIETILERWDRNGAHPPRP